MTVIHSFDWNPLAEKMNMNMWITSQESAAKILFRVFLFISAILWAEVNLLFLMVWRKWLLERLWNAICIIWKLPFFILCLDDKTNNTSTSCHCWCTDIFMMPAPCVCPYIHTGLTCCIHWVAARSVKYIILHWVSFSIIKSRTTCLSKMCLLEYCWLVMIHGKFEYEYRYYFHRHGVNLNVFESDLLVRLVFGSLMKSQPLPSIHWDASCWIHVGFLNWDLEIVSRSQDP